MLQYEIYVPLNYGNGQPIEEALLNQTKEELVRKFQGLTVYPPALAPAEGFWVQRGQMILDEIIILRVITREDADEFLISYKEVLERRFQQDEVLVVKYPAQIL